MKEELLSKHEAQLGDFGNPQPILDLTSQNEVYSLAIKPILVSQVVSSFSFSRSLLKSGLRHHHFKHSTSLASKLKLI